MINAVLWDMDGVIVDSNPHHARAWIKTLANHGVELTPEQYAEFAGRRDSDTIRYYMGIKVTDKMIADISREKQATYRQIAQAEGIKALPGVIELIKRIDSSNTPQALVTSSPWKNVDLVLSALGIDDCFDVIVGPETTLHGKPHPEGYLLAAKVADVDPWNCVIIEDSIAGVQAGKRIGAFVIAVTNTTTKKELAKANADLIVESLTDSRIPYIVLPPC